MQTIYQTQPTLDQEKAVAENSNMNRLLSNFNRCQRLRINLGHPLLDMPNLVYSDLGNNRTLALFSFVLFGRTAKVALTLLMDGTIVNIVDNTETFFVG